MDTKKKSAKAETVTEDGAPQEEKRKPVHTIRHQDCSASIWVREHLVRGQMTKFWSVTLERSYKDRDGSWKYTKTFDADALGTIVMLCQQASEFIATQEQEASV